MTNIRYINGDDEMKKLFSAYWEKYTALSNENYALLSTTQTYNHHMTPRCLTQDNAGGLWIARLTIEQHEAAHIELFETAKTINILSPEALSKLEFAARAFGRKPSKEDLDIHDKCISDTRAIVKGRTFICYKLTPWKIQSVKANEAKQLIAAGTHRYFHQGTTVFSLDHNKYIRVTSETAKEMLLNGLATGIAKGKSPCSIEGIDGIKIRARLTAEQMEPIQKAGGKIILGTTNGFACAVNKKTGEKSMVPKGAIAMNADLVGSVYNTCPAILPDGQVLRVPVCEYYRERYGHSNKGYAYMYPDAQAKRNKAPLIRYPVSDIPKAAVHASSGTIFCRSQGKRVPLNELTQQETTQNSPNYNKAYLYDIDNEAFITVPKSLKSDLLKSGKYDTTSALFHLISGNTKRQPKTLFKQGGYREWRSTSSGEYKRHKYNIERLYKFHGEADSNRWLSLAKKHQAVWAYSSVLSNKKVFLRDIQGKVIKEASSIGRIYSDFPIYSSVNNQKRSFCSLANQIEVKYDIEFGDSLMMFAIHAQQKEALQTQGPIDGRNNSLANIIKREYFADRLSEYIKRREMLTCLQFEKLVKELYAGGEWRRYKKQSA